MSAIGLISAIVKIWFRLLIKRLALRSFYGVPSVNRTQCLRWGKRRSRRKIPWATLSRIVLSLRPSMYVSYSALYAAFFLRLLCGMSSRFLSSSIVPDLIRLSLSVSLHEPFLVRLFVRCLHMPTSVRTPLYNLFPFVHPEVVPILPQHPSQLFYRYYQFCYHKKLFCLLISLHCMQACFPSLLFLRLLAPHCMRVHFVFCSGI